MGPWEAGVRRVTQHSPFAGMQQIDCCRRPSERQAPIFYISTQRLGNPILELAGSMGTLARHVFRIIDVGWALLPVACSLVDVGWALLPVICFATRAT